jgi:hypothetical protein
MDRNPTLVKSRVALSAYRCFASSSLVRQLKIILRISSAETVRSEFAF